LLGERGAKVVIAARSSKRLSNFEHLITTAGGDVIAVPTDVRRRDDISRLVASACERYGKFDVLISNAGIAPNSPLDELRVDDRDEMIDVNIRA